MNEYPKEWIETLTHMTGSQQKKGQGWRNYYAVTPKTPAHSILMKMQNAGIVEPYRTAWNMIYFRATLQGCQAIGMTKAGIKRTLNFQ